MIGIENFESGAFSPEHAFPEIGGFDEHSELSNAQVEHFIQDMIPSEHLENCPGIYCAPDHPIWAELPGAAGVYFTATSEIFLAGHDVLEGTGTTELEVLLHEIGHNAYSLMLENDPQAAADWAELHMDSLTEYEETGLGFVSNYSHSNLFEDFAESYSEYVANPELMQFLCPEKYEFMRERVFRGNEFERMETSDGSSSIMIKEIGRALSEAADSGTGQAAAAIVMGGQGEPVSDVYRCFTMTASS